MAATNTSRNRRLALIIVVAAVIVAVTWIVIASVRGSATSDTSAHLIDGVPQSALPVTTEMGVVELSVANLDVMREYYEGAVGLRVLEETSGGDTESVLLGLDRPILRLEAHPAATGFAAPTEAGLYHSAIRYPEATDLARTLLRIATHAPSSYQGSADHMVSLAFYFGDPEGNGLELYTDRPSDEWTWNNGEVEMGAYALDPNQFITEHLGTDLSLELGDTAVADMGHLHLKVGDLAAAEQFYADTLGFAVTSRADGAIFYAAGGYHHHLATNTWQSDGAKERTEATGLSSFAVVVGDAAEVAEVASRLDAAGVKYATLERGLSVLDPWGNEVQVLER